MDLKSVPLSEDPNVASGTQEARLCDRAVCHQSIFTAQHNERRGILSAESIHQMAAMTAGGQQLQPCYHSKRDCSITSRPFRPGTLRLCFVKSVQKQNESVTLTAHQPGHVRSLIATSQRQKDRAPSCTWKQNLLWSSSTQKDDTARTGKPAGSCKAQLRPQAWSL